jgi:hypothetical protein
VFLGLIFTCANFDSNGGSREELIEHHAHIQAEFNQKDGDYEEVKLTLEVSCANFVVTTVC